MLKTLLLALLMFIPRPFAEAQNIRVPDFKDYPDVVDVSFLDIELKEIVIIRIENPEGVKVGNFVRPKGATCVMVRNSLINVFGEQKSSGRFLIVYEPRTTLSEGECPAGTVGFVSTKTLKYLIEKYLH